MGRWVPESNAGFAAFNPAEISAILDTAVALGITPAATLEGTGLTATAVFQGKCKVSLQQHACAVVNATQNSSDSLMALRSGLRLHLSAFGIVGYALWSSHTLHEALKVAAAYAPLLNLKFGPTISIENGEAVLSFSQPAGLSAQETELSVEFEVAKVVRFIRDLQLQDCGLFSVCLLSECAKHLAAAGTMLGCASTRHGAVAQIRFDAALLDHPLPQANPRTQKACLVACDQLMETQDGDLDLAASVRAILANASQAIPTLPEVASQLCLSARTLRRRLDLMNTSYSQLLDDVRKTLAIRYVGSTTLTTELIAEKLGYSDAANFSHAFKRWTGQAPRQYRYKRDVPDDGAHATFTATMYASARSLALCAA